MSTDTIADTGTDSAQCGRVVVGASWIDVTACPDGRVALAVHERQPDRPENNDVTLSLPVRIVQSAVRSLRLVARLAGGTEQRAGAHPIWCDPYNHLADWQPHAAAVGEFHFGRQTLEVVLYRPAPDAPTLVGVYAGHQYGPDAVVDMPPDAALELARLLRATYENG